MKVNKRLCSPGNERSKHEYLQDNLSLVLYLNCLPLSIPKLSPFYNSQRNTEKIDVIVISISQRCFQFSFFYDFLCHFCFLLHYFSVLLFHSFLFSFRRSSLISGQNTSESPESLAPLKSSAPHKKRQILFHHQGSAMHYGLLNLLTFTLSAPVCPVLSFLSLLQFSHVFVIVQSSLKSECIYD